MATKARDERGTDAAMLDVAERLVQTRGFNGFSYADVAQELSVTKASLHYHFPSKAELGEALIDRYAGRFAASLTAIAERHGDGAKALDAYAGLYADVLVDNRMCLCGMLAAEYETLPEPMREAIVRFFDMNEEWLAGVLSRGREAGSFSFTGPPRDTARTILDALEGAMLVERARGGIGRFHSTAQRLVARLAGTTGPADRRGGSR